MCLSQMKLSCLRSSCVVARRIFSSHNGTTGSESFLKLKSRSLLRIEGKDTVDFLQGLITNDMRHLTSESATPKCIYGMILNNKGRLMYDVILYKIGSDASQLLLECDATAAQKVIALLKMYKLRKQVDLSPCSDYSIWHCLGETNQSIPPGVFLFVDPRLPDLGNRMIASNSFAPVSESSDLSTYRTLRYKLGVAEGVDEHLVAKCIPLETNIEFLHGISFHKGCYVGQELTARAHHTGVIRKRIMPLEFTDAPSINFSVPEELRIVNENAKPVGVLRAVEGVYGIGLMRWCEALEAKELRLSKQETLVKVHKPKWWPENMKR